jgi:hypothetical protein
MAKQRGNSRPDIRDFMTFSIRIFILMLSLIIFARQPASAADVQTLNEQQIKSAIVYNIARYVTWPNLPVGDTTPFVIGVYGQNRSISAWNSLTGKVLHGKKIIVKRCVDPDELASCQLVIIEPSERKNIHRVLAALKELPILTVSEIDGFSSNGGMITLHMINNRMAFNVNLKSARSANLIISSNILKLATDVIQ